MVKYNRPIPEFIPKSKDFKEKKIEVGMFLHWRNRGVYYFRLLFKAPGIYAEIRTVAGGESIAVDFRHGFNHNNCLTTEATSFKMALAILWEEFRRWNFGHDEKLIDAFWPYGFR